MDEFKNENSNPEGELKGFDSTNENNATEQNGYTVTQDGGFYTKQRQDIIQDDISSSSANTTPNPTEQNIYKNNNYNYNPKKSNKTKKHGTSVVIIASILSAVIGLSGGILGGLGSDFINEKLNGTTSNLLSSDQGNKNNVNISIEETAESVVEAVAQKVTPSVVGIRTTTSVTSFFGGSSEATGEGSGVIYSKDGYIITNYHVISDAVANKSGSKIEVFLDSSSSEAYQATVVGYHISADLAVIKINANNLTAIEIADSDSLKVGQYVITVGNPGGLEFMDSVTYGIVSGLNRVVSTDSEIKLIQTDAAINPGNSGGALVNTKGELVGINSSKIVSEEYEGMGFAIPTNTAIDICKNIIEKENSPEAYVGITISTKYTSKVLDYYGFPNGAVVSSVADNSPAYNAGIRKGDIITEYNSTKITEYQVLEECIEESMPGDKASVKIYRSGRYYSTTLTVGSNNQLD